MVRVAVDDDGAVSTSRPNLINRLELEEFSLCCWLVGRLLLLVLLLLLELDGAVRRGKISAASFTTKYFSMRCRRWCTVDDGDDDNVVGSDTVDAALVIVDAKPFSCCWCCCWDNGLCLIGECLVFMWLWWLFGWCFLEDDDDSIGCVCWLLRMILFVVLFTLNCFAAFLKKWNTYFLTNVY